MRRRRTLRRGGGDHLHELCRSPGPSDHPRRCGIARRDALPECTAGGNRTPMVQFATTQICGRSKPSTQWTALACRGAPPCRPSWMGRIDIVEAEEVLTVADHQWPLGDVVP